VNNNAFLKLRPLASLAFIGLLLIACASGCHSLENQAALKAATDNGVTLSCSVPSTAKAGQPVPLLIFLTTTNFESPRCYVDLQSNPRINIVLLDSRGREVPKTDHGRELIEPGPGNSSKIYVDRILRPNTSPKELPRWSLDLNDLFVLPPGKYTAQVTMPIAIFSPLQKFNLTITNLNFEVRK
jgi:hypothetical protein